ncbi:box C/D snoRNP rRNA 2'-O-methylation factor, putative [Plasmodium gaboni]|uniref:Nucleolar protein 56 n=1 Tax=Plasmodium gaboni TaxID=647221 RepID=A0ABY1UP74_9APIC|nr:box C/D snoRNP rRNA 2'-O-methylation factor, putative [Plasmodium gaboni]
MKKLYILFECSAGYFLLKIEEWEQIGSSEELEKKILKSDIFHQMVEFCAFIPFETAERALDNLLNINEGKATPFLLSFLEQNLPNNKNKYELGVADINLGKNLSNVGFNIIHNNNVLELFRACRQYYLKKISTYVNNIDIDIKHFNIGLGHSYSRSKLKLDPRKQDKSIINSIGTIESLDKNINLFSMRVIEWYSWHFPELKKIVTDVCMYCKLVNLIQIKEKFDFDEYEDKINDITQNEDLTKNICKVANLSIGQELTEEDLANILNFSNEVINLSNTRNILWNYLDNKLNIVSPNLKELLGNTLSARLISHAGSLVNLAKCPSSSIQIFGSEKALFNSLKGNKKTPKYGILYNSSYISKTPLPLKGRMSRYLSCKSAMAARIDSFSDYPTNSYGLIFKKQLEHKIQHMVKGVKLSKNIDYINEAEQIYRNELSSFHKDGKLDNQQKNDDKKKKKKKKKNKRKHDEDQPSGHSHQDEQDEKDEQDEGEKKKKRKKDKKKKKKDKKRENNEAQNEDDTNANSQMDDDLNGDVNEDLNDDVDGMTEHIEVQDEDEHERDVDQEQEQEENQEEEQEEQEQDQEKEQEEEEQEEQEQDQEKEHDSDENEEDSDPEEDSDEDEEDD